MADKKEITIDDLALMVQKGFNEMGGRMENRFDDIESDVKIIKSNIEEIKTNLNKKVDRFEHKDLEIRVEKVEENLKLKQKLKFA